MNVYLLSFLFIFVVQLLFFVYAAWFKTDKVTDLAYGLTFSALVVVLIYYYQALNPVQLLVGGFVFVWGMRLAGYLFIRILKIKKDDRFDGRRGNLLKFARFWGLQTIAIWTIMLPVAYLLNLNILSNSTMFLSCGIFLWVWGFIWESVADWQKFTFKNKPGNKNKWISSGLWKYSRYPNYFGEMLCWWGIFIIVVPYISGLGWLTIFGPIFITFLLLFVSGIPLLEKRYKKKYGNNPKYKEYVRNTSLLIPWFAN